MFFTPEFLPAGVVTFLRVAAGVFESVFFLLVVAFRFGCFGAIFGLGVPFDCFALSNQPFTVVFRWGVTFEVERFAPLRR